MRGCARPAGSRRPGTPDNHRRTLLWLTKAGETTFRKGMTVIQALAQGGGPTARGTERGLKLLRRSADGSSQEIRPKMTDLIQPDDVLYVRESLF